MEIPEGYNHKATSDSFTGADRVVVYYSKVEQRYLVVLTSTQDEDNNAYMYMTKGQLELTVHAGGDALEIAAR